MSVLVQNVSPEKEKKSASMRPKNILFPWQYGLSLASSSIPYECFRFDFFQAPADYTAG